MKRTLIPTDSELEILQILWNYGPSTVRFVHEELSKTKQVGYTTTLKLMQIMAEKGIAKRDTSIRTHVYLSNLKQSETQKSLLKKFITSAYAGSATSLVLQALGHHSPSDKELQEIKALIEKIENQKS